MGKGNLRRFLALSLLLHLPTKWKCYFSYKPYAAEKTSILLGIARLPICARVNRSELSIDVKPIRVHLKWLKTFKIEASYI
jgi:hypothetical protein